MYALQAQGVVKAYGGVKALKGVDFAVRPGSVRLMGQDTRFRSTAHALTRGVAVVAQDLSLFPHLDILDNLFPMREPRLGPFIDRRRMRDPALPVLEELGITRRLTTPVCALTLAERQLLEIAKALIAEPKVLLLDEPTSALEAGESERLLKILRLLRDRRVGVVFVSHILEEVMNLCDEVTILQDGKVVLAQADLRALTMADIAAAMLGSTGEARRAERAASPRAVPARLAAAGRGLTVTEVNTADVLSHVSFAAEPGEIVGLSGLAGSGPAAVIAAIAGLTPLECGRITLPGGQDRPRSFREAVRRGVALVSGDRRRLGLMLDKPIWENIVQVRSVGLARDGALLRTAGLRGRAARPAQQVGVKSPSVLLAAGSLSGGNQQKVVLAKWLDCSPTLLRLDDPTRGVDIGARAEINQLLLKTAADGAVTLYLSTDLEELVTRCDRVLVFHRGRICGELSGPALTAPALSQAMNTGLMPTPA